MSTAFRPGNRTNRIGFGPGPFRSDRFQTETDRFELGHRSDYYFGSESGRTNSDQTVFGSSYIRTGSDRFGLGQRSDYYFGSESDYGGMNGILMPMIFLYKKRVTFGYFGSKPTRNQ